MERPATLGLWLGGSVAAGLALALAVPTTMLPSPQPEWRKDLRDLPVVDQGDTASLVYFNVPQDLSTEVGYGNVNYYDAYYAANSERPEYGAAPDYTADPVRQAAQDSADDARRAARIAAVAESHLQLAVFDEAPAASEDAAEPAEITLAEAAPQAAAQVTIASR